MKIKSNPLLASLVLIAAAAGGHASAADLEAGRAAFEKFACASCHGADGKSSVMPTYPVLAGQHEDYLVHALRAYKRGATGSTPVNARKNAVMTAMAQQLSEADVRNIAAWLARQPSDLAVRR
jgi:cytochrome c553